MNLKDLNLVRAAEAAFVELDVHGTPTTLIELVLEYERNGSSHSLRALLPVPGARSVALQLIDAADRADQPGRTPLAS